MLPFSHSNKYMRKWFAFILFFFIFLSIPSLIPSSTCFLQSYVSEDRLYFWSSWVFFFFITTIGFCSAFCTRVINLQRKKVYSQFRDSSLWLWLALSLRAYDTAAKGDGWARESKTEVEERQSSCSPQEPKNLSLLPKEGLTLGSASWASYHLSSSICCASLGTNDKCLGNNKGR